MNEQYNEQTELLLDETVATPAMMWWLTGIMLCSGVVGGLAGARGEISLLLLGVIAAMLVVMLLGIWGAYWLICRSMRLKMDATRVWTHIPLTKDRSLAWGDIRTAAVVTLKGMNYPTMIILSIHAPEEALTRKRMMWKNARRGEEMRIPLTEQRRAIVEQQLNMQLPDITL